VTAYMDGVLVGTATTTAPSPGTWPTGVLSFSSQAGFNQVVVHYDQRPLCTDYGPIFMADNMNVTARSSSVPGSGPGALALAVAPNPFVAVTQVRLTLAHSERLTATIHDPAGRLVRTLVHDATLEAGARTFTWDGRDDDGTLARSGVYFCRIRTHEGARTTPLIMRH
jgi:flagellar hook capping protein FlgD